MTGETDEILSDADLMEQIRKSEEDIKAGRTVPLDELERETEQPPERTFLEGRDPKI